MVIPRKLRRLAAIFATHEDCSTGSCCWKRRFSFGSSLKRTRRQKKWTKCFVTGILGRWSWLACEEFKREPNPRCRTSRSTHVLFPVISKCTGVRPVSRYFFARVSAPPYRARLLAFESVIPNAKSEIERGRGRKKKEGISVGDSSSQTDTVLRVSRLSRWFLKRCRWSGTLIRDVRGKLNLTGDADERGSTRVYRVFVFVTFNGCNRQEQFHVFAEIVFKWFF